MRFIAERGKRERSHGGQFRTHCRIHGADVVDREHFVCPSRFVQCKQDAGAKGCSVQPQMRIIQSVGGSLNAAERPIDLREVAYSPRDAAARTTRHGEQPTTTDT